MCPTEMHKDTTPPVPTESKNHSPKMPSHGCWSAVDKGDTPWDAEPGAEPGNVGREEGPPTPVRADSFTGSRWKEQFQE